MGSAPIASHSILGKGAKDGSLFIAPSDLREAISYTIASRRLKLYSDGSGKHLIPEEWREEGIRIEAYPVFRGRFPDVPTISYIFFKGKSDIGLGR